VSHLTRAVVAGVPAVARVPGWLLALPAAAAASVLLWAWTPSDDPAQSICFHRRALGVPCPGCGMVRAAAQLAKGNWHAAVAYHPLVGLLAVQAVVAWGWWALSALGRVRAPRRVTVNGWLLGNLGLLVAVWVVRLLTGTLPP
jgi:hypothetical protein